MRITLDSTANLSYDNEVKGIWNQITVKTVTKSQEGSASESLFLECSEEISKEISEKEDLQRAEADGVIARRKAEYENLLAQIAEQARIAEDNKSGFLGLGRKAQIRKEALQKNR